MSTTFPQIAFVESVKAHLTVALTLGQITGDEYVTAINEVLRAAAYLPDIHSTDNATKDATVFARYILGDEDEQTKMQCNGALPWWINHNLPRVDVTTTVDYYNIPSGSCIKNCALHTMDGVACYTGVWASAGGTFNVSVPVPRCTVRK